mgnify:CR=1 FL=1
MTSPVRVRFAPSPTGYLHVGGLRTALYNYLFARRHGGAFLLRIEDTDQARSVPGAVEGLIQALKWADLEYDEGPGVGGLHGPYVQSERLALYRSEVDRLVASGHAYACFCTAERLDEVRKRQEKEKRPSKYDRTCVVLPTWEVARRRDVGELHVIRMRVPDAETIVVQDIVRGEVSFESDTIDDSVLLKSDGFPTYHLANVVDDHDMRISHVIRGEEWLPSTPKHLLLYRAFGYDAPQFAHLPLLLNPDRSKLSKRQGHVAVEEYRDAGYYPEALVNFVAFLGWNPGGEREIFSLEELVPEFSLERVNKAGAIFNVEKLDWFNSTYLRARPAEQILAELRPALTERGWDRFGDAYLLRVIELMRERVRFPREYLTEATYLFEDPTAYEAATREKRWTADSPRIATALLERIVSLEPFSHDPIEGAFKSVAEAEGVKTGDLVHPVRLALSGIGRGPSLYDMMDLLGRDVCLRRIRAALERLAPPR